MTVIELQTYQQIYYKRREIILEHIPSREQTKREYSIMNGLVNKKSAIHMPLATWMALFLF